CWRYVLTDHQDAPEMLAARHLPAARAYRPRRPTHHLARQSMVAAPGLAQVNRAALVADGRLLELEVEMRDWWRLVGSRTAPVKAPNASPPAHGRDRTFHSSMPFSCIRWLIASSTSSKSLRVRMPRSAPFSTIGTTPNRSRRISRAASSTVSVGLSVTTLLVITDSTAI